jgi:undecaprenyl-diphosphatase
MDLTFWHAVLLGLVQGLTEFLPISSSAHLIIVPWLFNIPEPGLEFDAALHVGTLCAVLVFFRNEFIGMAKAIPEALHDPRRVIGQTPTNEKEQNAKLLWLIVIGCVPGVMLGLGFESKIEDLFHNAKHENRALAIIAISMMVLAGALLVAERIAKHRRPLSSLNLKDAVVIGFAQALALIPGVSRSGATITAGLFRDLKRADAARFSFLLGSPIIAGAGAKALKDLADSNLTNHEMKIIAVGVIVAAVSGFFAIGFLLKYLQRRSTMVFIIYRFALGISILLLIVTGVK